MRPPTNHFQNGGLLVSSVTSQVRYQSRRLAYSLKQSGKLSRLNRSKTVLSVKLAWTVTVQRVRERLQRGRTAITARLLPNSPGAFLYGRGTRGGRRRCLGGPLAQDLDREAYHATKGVLVGLRSRSTRSAAYRNRHDWTARIEHLTPSSSLRQSWRRPFGVRQIRTLPIRG